MISETEQDTKPKESEPQRTDSNEPADESADTNEQAAPREIGGRKGPDPVRYGDWEKQGRCIDF